MRQDDLDDIRIGNYNRIGTMATCMKTMCEKLEIICDQLTEMTGVFKTHCDRKQMQIIREQMEKTKQGK